MMTQSHFLVTAFVAHRCRKAGQPVRMGVALLGSVLPDLPLALLTVWFFAVPRAAEPAVAGDPFGELYDRYFFNEPVWIVAHNMLHAPLILAALFGVGWLISRRGRPWGVTLCWFAAAAAFHTIIDVFTHHNDGPLLLFPFDWSLRAQAPISYWDPSHGGAIFSIFETGLDLAIIGYFLIVWIAWRRSRETPSLAGRQ